jgi:hypothetical protein
MGRGGVSNVITVTTAPDPNTPKLTVTIHPPQAVLDGARWRLLGEDEWLESGRAIDFNYLGEFTVEFLPITGWDHPRQPICHGRYPAGNFHPRRLCTRP